jgi:hypothetical protein
LRDFMAYYCVTEDELYGKQSYHFLSLAFFGECLSSLCGSARPVEKFACNRSQGTSQKVWTLNGSAAAGCCDWK